MTDLEDPKNWLGRRVKIIDGPAAEVCRTDHEVGVVICVDATEYRPSAWVKITDESVRMHPAYRSCDMCWLEDVETKEIGPVWVGNVNSPDHGRDDAKYIRARVHGY